ncbi:MAG: hypothetical protein ACREA0_08020, partial [bacterium]
MKKLQLLRGGWMFRRSVMTVLVASSLTLGTGVFVTATAQPFGPTEGCCHFADNSNHTYYFVDLDNETYKDAAKHAVNHLDNGTQMTTKKAEEPTDRTDVLWLDGYYGGNLLGLWDCTSLNTAGEC